MAAAETAPAPAAAATEERVPAPAPEVAAAPAPATDSSAGLGNLQVLSKLGRPLRAEIELLSRPRGDEAPLVVRMASAEAFRRAGVAFHPMLNGVDMAIELRDGKPVIALTTRLPVNELVLNVLFEVERGSTLFLREYAIVLDPATNASAPPSQAVQGDRLGLSPTLRPRRDADNEVEVT